MLNPVGFPGQTIRIEGLPCLSFFPCLLRMLWMEIFVLFPSTSIAFPCFMSRSGILVPEFDIQNFIFFFSLCVCVSSLPHRKITILCILWGYSTIVSIWVTHKVSTQRQRFFHSPSYVYNVLDFDQLLLVQVSDDSLTSCDVSSQLERITASGTS